MTDLSAANLRKRPRQERSRQMVERIVDAGQFVLERDGFRGFTTNRVADEAGISPGSLYQYFGDKDAILAAIVDGRSRLLADELAAVVHPPVGDDLLGAVRATFDGLLGVLERHREYVRFVTTDVPRSGLGSRADEVERRIDDMVQAYLSMLPRQGRRLSPAGSAWLLVRLVEHLAVRWVLDQPPIARDVLLDELVSLTLTHLERA